MKNLKKYLVVFKNGDVKRPMPSMSDEGVEMVKFSDIKDILKPSHNKASPKCPKFGHRETWSSNWQDLHKCDICGEIWGTDRA